VQRPDTEDDMTVAQHCALQGAGRQKADAFMDLVVPIGLTVLCAVSFGMGVKKIVSGASGVRCCPAPHLAPVCCRNSTLMCTAAQERRHLCRPHTSVCV